MESSHSLAYDGKMPEYKQTYSGTVHKVDLDSGYLSDLLEASRKNEQVANAFFNSSSPPSYSRSVSLKNAFVACHSHIHSGLILGTFETPTNWDKGCTITRKPKDLNKACEELAAKVKPPTRFPIAVLPSTLARARAEANSPSISHDCKVHLDLLDTGGPVKVKRKADTHPRIRYASKRRRAIVVNDTGDSDDDFQFQPQPLKDEERKFRFQKCLENV